eukprot:5609677-Karenia_brevis.AAC.1
MLVRRDCSGAPGSGHLECQRSRLCNTYLTQFSKNMFTANVARGTLVRRDCSGAPGSGHL